MRWVLIITAITSCACDQLTATVTGVSILTETPRLQDTEGLSVSLAEAIDDAASVAGLGSVFAIASVGERSSFIDTSAPEPLSGAQVTLEGPSAEVGLCELLSSTPGTYQVTSQPASGCDGTNLEYVVGAKYVTAIETASELYTLTIERAPGPVDSVSFSPVFSEGGLGGLPAHPRSTALTVDWSQNARELDGFVTVFRIEFVGTTPLDVVDAASWQPASGNPVFDNFPTSSSDVLDFAFGDPVSSATIPANALSEPGLYFVLVTAVELNDVVSSNLSLGSTAVAGVGRAFAFWID